MATGDTYYDKLINRLKNNKVVALAIAFVAIFTGTVTLIANFDRLYEIILTSDTAKADIILSQFTVNSEDSYYVEKVVDGRKPFSVVSCCDEGSFYLSELQIKQDSIVEISPTNIGLLSMGILRDLAMGENPHQSGFIKALLESPNFSIDTKKEIRRWIKIGAFDREGFIRVLGGNFPILDVSFLNRSENPAILKAIKVQGFMFLEGGDSYMQETGVGPIPVTHRYIIDLSKYKKEPEDLSTSSGWLAAVIESPEISTTPPIKIGSKNALRIQVQLIETAVDISGQQYLLKLSFQFSNGDMLSADYFSWTI